ncbi:MAG: peptide ABC transporter substrate-binding protein [Chloroflexota bacterium]|nr:peptide ABC transporter substrate-binding protein [Chloroflexota bacterium]
MLVAACGQGAQPTPTASGGAATAAAATRGQGGELKILYWQAPTILNGHQATGTKDYDAARLVLEPLASFGKDGLPVANALAAEIPTVANGGVSKDFKVVTWKLRTGVKWSDGTAFKASDVAFTYKYQCDPLSATSTSSYCAGVDSVVAKDDATAVLTYKDTQPFFYQWGVGGNNMVLQEAQYKGCVGAAAKACAADQKPIGTGPYKVDTFKPGDTVTYSINESFRDPKKPFFKTVTFKGGGDAPGAARAAFQTGEVDYAWNLQVDAAILKPMATASTTANLVTVYGSSVERILVNFSNPAASLGDKRGEPDTQHPFLTDKAVRRALAMATDRTSVATQIYGDGLTGKASCNILTAPELMNSKNTASLDICKFDVNAAGAELEKAGWLKGADGVRAKGGVKLEITYQTTINAVRQKVQDIMKSNWEKAGFKVTLKSVDAGVFFTNTSPDGANHFWADIEMYTNSGDPDPTSYFNGWTSAQATGKANNWQSGNYSRYQNKDFDAIVASLRTETDQSKRNELAIKANDLLVSDVVVIPLINRTFATSGVSKSLKGVDPTPWDSEMWNLADWSK